ncbi:MAG TPA: hypothetical protein VNC50_04720, partial [Planctomycetia bacterium]|nr:hypothetical protein [Planctomycetia bacterium]
MNILPRRLGRKTISGLLALAATAFFVPAAPAQSDHADYVQALQDNQMADLAVDYLRILEKRPGLAKGIKDELDYDLAQALMALAEVADAETERKSHDEASERFRRYLGSHGKSERGIDSRNQLAYVLLKRGQRSLTLADAEKDAKRVAAHRVEARKQFDQARKDFDAAIDEYGKTIAGAGDEEEAEKASKQARRKERLQAALVQARLNRAMVDYQAARSYGATEKPRKEALKSAENLFAQIAADTGKGNITPASIYAALFQAKAVGESGNLN